MSKQPIYCSCCTPPHLIGVRTNSGILVRRKGREIEAALPAKIKCEKCGAITSVTAEGEAK
ncbi:MAG: hypothetical protein RR394_09725 [Oscillospiraceae bacterium]